MELFTEIILQPLLEALDARLRRTLPGYDEYDQCIECSKCLGHEPGCGKA